MLMLRPGHQCPVRAQVLFLARFHDYVIVFSQNRMSDTSDSTEQMQSTPDAGGRGQFVDDGGDATPQLRNDGMLPDPENSVNPATCWYFGLGTNAGSDVC